MRTRIWLLAVILIAVLVVLFWSSDITLVPHQHNSTVLVLDNCDDDFKTPPFEDAVIAFGPNGTVSRLLTNLNTCQTIGGGRCLAVSGDGRFFVACEIVGRHLIACEKTGKRLWSVDGEFTAATVAQDGKVYAIISSGTIYGDQTVIIDRAGRITKIVNTAGFDMVLDEQRKVLWLVGKTIKKCDLELNVLFEIKPIKWCASSVDVDSDGSVWVAEREHPDVRQSTNRLLKIDSSGQIIRTVNLAWSPFCLRVEPSDGSVWVTGFGVGKPMTQRLLNSIEQRTGSLPIGRKARDFLTRTRVSPETDKYDRDGKLLHRISKGGYTLEIDPSDDSVWFDAQEKIYHCSQEAKKLGVIRGVSADNKYIAVISSRAEAKTSSVGKK